MTAAELAGTNGGSYMVAKYGSAYRDDENLVIKEERYGKQVYYAASDTTSETNSPVTLLMRKHGKGLCEVLATPPIANLKALGYDKQGRPVAFLAKDQGTTSRESYLRMGSLDGKIHANDVQGSHLGQQESSTQERPVRKFNRMIESHRDKVFRAVRDNRKWPTYPACRRKTCMSARGRMVQSGEDR